MSTIMNGNLQDIQDVPNPQDKDNVINLQDLRDVPNPQVQDNRDTYVVDGDNCMPTIEEKTMPSTEQKKFIKKAIALWGYAGVEDYDQLSFKAGDEIIVLEEDKESGWWWGELNGKRGHFPVNYTEVREPDIKEANLNKLESTENLQTKMASRKILLKIVVLGESGVGKSSLLIQYVDNKFRTDYFPTIGTEFLSKPIEVDDQPVTLQIWDSPGQEHFQGLDTTFYRGSDGVIFVFDVSRKSTFDALAQWKSAFLIQVGQEGNENFPMLVVANKVDLEERAVTTPMIQNFCKDHNLDFVECCAKDVTNVGNAFEKITRKVISQLKPEDIQYDNVKLDLQ